MFYVCNYSGTFEIIFDYFLACKKARYGFFVTKSKIEALRYCKAVNNSGYDNRIIPYATYFKSAI